MSSFMQRFSHILIAAQVDPLGIPPFPAHQLCRDLFEPLPEPGVHGPIALAVHVPHLARSPPAIIRGMYDRLQAREELETGRAGSHTIHRLEARHD